MKKLIYTLILLIIVNTAIPAQSRRIFIANKFLEKAFKHLKNKDYFLAKRYYERAYWKFKIENDFKGQFNALKGIGDVNMQRGYIDRAFDNYNRASYFAYRSGMIHSIAFVELSTNVARVHESHKQYKTALTFLQNAIKIGAAVGYPFQGANLQYLAKLQQLSQKYGNIPGH